MTLDLNTSITLAIVVGLTIGFALGWIVAGIRRRP